MLIPSTLIQAGGAGALVPLEQHTASASASLDFTSFISATYDEYLFEIVGILPVTDNVDFYIQFSNAGVWDTAVHYQNNHLLQATSGNVSVTAGASQFAARNNGEITNNSAKPMAGRLALFSPASSTLLKHMVGNILWAGGTNWVNTIFHGVYVVPNAVDGVRFKFSSGNIASGDIRVYGISPS